MNADWNLAGAQFQQVMPPLVFMKMTRQIFIALFIISHLCFLLNQSASYGSSVFDRGPIKLTQKNDAYYLNKGFISLENKVFSIYLPPEINLDSALSYNEFGKQIKFNKGEIKKNNYVHIQSSDKSHYEIDKYRIDNPSSIIYQYRVILKKEDGIRKDHPSKNELGQSFGNASKSLERTARNSLNEHLQSFVMGIAVVLIHLSMLPLSSALAKGLKIFIYSPSVLH